MKHILFCLASLSTTLSQAQHTYNVDVELGNANKLTYDLLDQHIETTNRSIDGNRLRFTTTRTYNMDSLFSVIGIEVFGVFTDKHPVESADKNGGVNCEQAQLLCNNQSFTANSSGFGTQELNATNRGCLGVEHQSSWYYLSIQTGGTLNMSITPTSVTDDYDFAIWGPFTSATVGVNCPPVGNPVRCSYAATSGATGLMNVTPNQNSEGALGDGWVEFLTVSPNEYYLLLIDNFSASNSGYNISWSGTATLGCLPTQLSVELTQFSVSSQHGINKITWKTSSETGSSHYLLERATDENFEVIRKVNSIGNTQTQTTYHVYDSECPDAINYYRLTQVDINGNSTTYGPISIDNRFQNIRIIKIVNILGQECNLDEIHGMYFEIYENGSIKRNWKN